ncbi:MAG: hypothetical protein ACPHEP_01545 [Acidimicrobiales bacterium]
MIDYLIEVKPLQDAGLSNSEIADSLNAATAGPMLPAPSEYILSDCAAVLVDPVSGEKFGSLIDYYATLEAGDAKNLIAFFLDRIYSNQDVGTNEYPRSVQFANVELTLPADLQAVCTKLVEEAGGRPHSGVTEADVAQSQADWEAEEQARIEQEQAAQEQAEAEQLVNQQLLALESRFSALYNQFIASALIDQRVVDEAAWVSGIQAMADNFVE